MNFEEWFQHTLEAEGGFVNDPDDKGKATIFGITMDSYSEFKGRNVTVDEIENMSLEDAEEFYQDYWVNLGLQGIPASIFPYYADAAVNLGKGGATKVLQMAVNTKMSPPNGNDWIDVDGIRGSGTNQALEAANLTANDYIAELMVWYSNLVLDGSRYGNRTNQNKFLRGWINRVLNNIKSFS